MWHEIKPAEVIVKVLEKLKAAAEENLDYAVTKCVITVPTNFNDMQRNAMKDACTIAGLECVRIINEPTAVAIADGLHI